MKRVNKVMSMLMIIMALVIGVATTNVYAAKSSVVKTSTDNAYTATGAGAATDHSWYSYYVDGQKAYCIEAGVVIHNNLDYNPTEEIYDARYSWIMYNVDDEQVKQACMWALGYNGSHLTGGDMTRVQYWLDRAAVECNVPAAANAEISGNEALHYDRATNTYRSDAITVSQTAGAAVTTSFGWLEGPGSGDGTYVLVVPADQVTGDMDITVTANTNNRSEGYGPATVWTCGSYQKVVTPNRSSSAGQPASKNFRITAVGDVKFGKVDEHGKPVPGVQFRITGGPDNINEILTTNASGIIELNEIRIGEYEITEIYVPGNLFIGPSTQNISYTVRSGYTNTMTFTAENDYKRGRTRLEKSDYDYDKHLKGDCTLANATYAIYAAENIAEGATHLFDANQEIIRVTTDEDGRTPVVKDIYCPAIGKMLDGIPIGKYYWKEIKAPLGYNKWSEIDPSHGFTMTEKTKDTIPFEIINDGRDMYSEDAGQYELKHTDKIITGRGIIIKYDNDNSNDETENDTDKSAAEGAVLRLRLKSAIGTAEEARNTYTATIDSKGFCEFKDPEYVALHPDDPYTIPYGTYELDEIQASNNGTHTYYYIQTEIVTISSQHQIERRIVADEPVPMYLKIVKRDKDTREEVHLAGAKYKIWDCQANRFIVQHESPSWEEKDEFVTNDEGYVYTYQKLYAGDYIVYEIEAPKGYYLDDEYRLPENEAYWGDETKGGVKIHVDKQALGVIESASPNKNDPDLVYVLDIYNSPLKAQLDVEKKGEKITGVKTANVSYETAEGETVDLEKSIATYSFVGLPNVTYEIYAANQIMSPDGRIEYVAKDEKVDTITTDENGYAITKELYLGEYRVIESKVPEGYLIDDEIPNVTLTNDNSLKRVEIHKKEYSDVRQKLGLTFPKVFEEVKYSNNETVDQRAVFGVFAKNDILTYTGSVAIKKGSLVDLIEVKGNNQKDEKINVTSEIDLPKGDYYVEEIYTAYPYTTSTKQMDYTLSYNGNPKQEFVVKSGEEFINDYDSASITLIKLSSTTVDNIILNGDEIDTSELDEKVQEILSAIKGMTEEEIKEYFKENNVKFVAGATYRVYTDEKCENPLRIKNEETGEFEIADLVTNETGLIKLEEVPLGHYYVKEVKAPEGYELSEEVVEIDLDLASKNTMIYQALIETEVKTIMIEKTDIFTSEVVPNCMFKIADLDGNVLLHSVTNEDGKAYIPVVMFENGKTYTYTEIKAPDIYDIDTTPHEFTAKINEEGEWVTDLIEVSNIRKTREVIVRKLDAETGDPLEGCVFTIALINPETGDIVVNKETGEPVYLVENAVTGENGEYVIEKAPMGTYKFMEIKAPEGYELDEDLTGYIFTIDNNSPETIIFEVTNTGDIAVVALVIVAVVCVLGVVFVIVKNKKSKK